jgi:hypothetical protein
VRFRSLGDGTQLRDFVYVDDAVDAFLRAGADDVSNGEVFNVGGMEPIKHRDLGRADDPHRGLGPLPLRRVAARQESDRHRRLLRDSSKIRSTLGWQPVTPLADGLRRTFEFYHAHLDQSRSRDWPTGRDPVTGERIPFIDLRPGDDGAAVRAAIDRVIARGWFVLGPEVEAFEAEFASASSAAHAVGVGTGTDAIALMLRAMNVTRGDEESPALTAVHALPCAGRRNPVFADIDPERLTLIPRL